MTALIIPPPHYVLLIWARSTRMDSNFSLQVRLAVQEFGIWWQQHMGGFRFVFGKYEEKDGKGQSTMTE